ncbi:MAG: alkaline phosphatase [Terrimonas sp.]|nr:alkaline phosphatase [Terrimonas sp.]
MSHRRKFIKDFSIGSAAIAIGIKDPQHIFPLASSGKGPYMATGIKIGEVSATEAIVWVRLTKNKERIDDTAPEPVILYKNDATGEFQKRDHGDSRPDLEPRVEYVNGSDINSIAGAVPAGEGEMRVLYKTANEHKWMETSWEKAGLDQDGIRQFQLSGLLPGKEYAIRVESRPSGMTNAANMMEGGFKTAPAKDDHADIRFMVVTCQAYHDRDYGNKGFKIYESMLKQKPDFFVHTGDIIYYDQQAKNLDLARWHWQRVYSFPTLVEFHKKVSSYFMKDDHDTWMNDCWPDMQTRFMGDFTFKQGQRLFLEQVPMGGKTYRSYRWGKHLQIWMVEGRDYRSANDMPDGPEKTIWGKEQINWFKQTVEGSDATYKILISPTPLVGPDRPKKNDNYANQGFYLEGEMLRRFVEEHDMFVVNGDRHWQYASKDAETGLLEFGCGPVSTEHAGGWNSNDRKPEHLYLNVIGGYLEVNIKHAGGHPEVIFTFHGVDGKILYEYKHQASTNVRNDQQ